MLQGNDFDGVFRSTEHFSALLGKEFDGSGLVGLDANIAIGDFGTLHQQLKTYENLVGMLHHQTVVGSDIGFALYGIDNDTLGICCGRGSEFDKGGETGTAHTHDAGILDAGNNLLGSQLGMVFHQFQLVGTVDVLFPFVTLNIDNNDGLAITGGIDSGVDLEHRSADRREDRSGNESSSLGNQRTDLHLVALLDNRFRRGTNMLRKGKYGLLR